MFKEVLHEIINRTQGCLGVLIMGTDGITVEKVLSVEATEKNFDVAIAEFTSLLRGAGRTNNDLGLGKLKEMTISCQSGTFIIRLVSEDYFLAMVMSPESIHGRGRYELSRAELLLEKEFAL